MHVNQICEDLLFSGRLGFETEDEAKTRRLKRNKNAAEVIKALVLALEAAQADQARYRWLRDVGDATWLALGKRPNVGFTHEIDAAIDAAIAAKA